MDQALIFKILVAAYLIAAFVLIRTDLQTSDQTWKLMTRILTTFGRDLRTHDKAIHDWIVTQAKAREMLKQGPDAVGKQILTESKIQKDEIVIEPNAII